MAESLGLCSKDAVNHQPDIVDVVESPTVPPAASDVLAEIASYWQSGIEERKVRSLCPDTRRLHLTYSSFIPKQLLTELREKFGLKEVTATNARGSRSDKSTFVIWDRVRGLGLVVITSVDSEIAGNRSSGAKQPESFKLNSAGIMIAVVGGDGSGKTSLLNSLEQWLEPLSITRFHFGKPRWSRTTSSLRTLLKMIRWLGFSQYIYASQAQELYEQESIEWGSFNLSHYDLLIREALIARDRMLAYRLARRSANRGSIVLCDRYPLRQIAGIDYGMVEKLASSRSGTWIKYINKLESRWYSRILPPDMIFVLRLPPELAVGRKTEEDASFVSRRNQAIWSLNQQAFPEAIFVDAQQSAAEVLASVKSQIWQKL